MTERIVGAVLVCAFLVGGYFTYDQAENAKDAAIQQREDIVAACERQNPLRQAVYDNILIDAKTREAAAAGFDDKKQRDAVAHFAAKGFKTLDVLVEAAAPVAAEPGGVTVDCEKAYPPPK